MVGAGAAGLTCAWLLGPEHEIVCYEALPTLGGNGRNEQVEVDGRLLAVAPGASFFPPAMNRLVLKLMRIVGTPLAALPTQFTVCDEEGEVRFASPSLRPLRLSPLRRPGTASDFLNWTKLVLAGRRLERAGDWLTPWGEFRAGLGLAPRFLEEVADPVVASLWGVSGAQALSALPQTSCRIAIHSDESALPTAPGDRSYFTMVKGHDTCQLTTLTGEVGGRPVYRSWVT